MKVPSIQDRKQIEQTIRVEGLQRKIVSLKEQMKDSATDQDARSYAALEVQLKDTEKMLQDLVAVPEDAFLKESEEAGLLALKGHRSVGGMRASIYNAMPEEGVDALVDFMETFEKERS